MADSSGVVAKSGGAGLGKKLGIGIGIVVGLLVVTYFVVTSQGFIKTAVLPRVGKALNATLTVDSLSLSPFSSLELRGLKVFTVGETPLLTATEIKVRYSLMDILGGKLTVNQLQIESPVVQIVPTPGGGDTLTPVLRGGSPETPGSSGPSSAPQLNIRQFTLNNALIRQLSGSPGQPSQTIEISRLGVTLDQLVTGQPGKLEITGDLRVDQAAQGAWNGKVDSKFDFALGANLLPSLLKGSLRAAVAQATGTFASLAGFSTSLTGDVTATEVKQLGLGFEQGGKNLGTVSLSGPFVAGTREGKLKLQVAGIDRQLLGSLTAGSGLDWGGTRISAQTDLDLQKGGQALKASGNVSITGLSVTQQGRKTPTLDLSLGYDTTTDLASQTARLDSLVLNGQQDNRALVNGTLTAPMTVAWGKTAGGAADAAWQVSIDELNLPDWRAFIGDVLTSGRLSAKANLAAVNGGKLLRLETQANVRDLGLALGTNGFRQGTLELQTKAQLTEFKQLSVDQLNLKLSQQGQAALAVSGSANWDQAQGGFSTKATLELLAQRLLGSGGTKPVQLQLSADGRLNPGAVLELKRLALNLTPTKLAPANGLEIQGRLDSSVASAQKGTFSIQAATLDLTPLYEALVDPQAAKAAPPEAAPSGLPRVEPNPTQLPFRPLTVELKLARVFLGEVLLADTSGSLQIDGGRIKLNALQSLLNGAPVKVGLDLDLGVVGTSYDVSAQLTGLPIEPWVNTFSPDFRGQVKGELFANAQIKGAGVTGTQLKKNLAAQINATVTNANIHVIQGNQKLWILPLDVNLIARLLNIPEITRSPIQQVDLQALASNGQIALSKALVTAPAFQAQATGGVQLADITDQSPVQIPLQISLSRAIAQKANLLSSDTPTNAAYVTLPQFAVIAGTLAKVETRTDNVQIAKLTARAVTGLLGNAPGNVVEGVGNVVNNLGSGLGGLLGGRKPSGTNAPGTTNKPTSSNPLNFLKKKP